MTAQVLRFPSPPSLFGNRPADIPAADSSDEREPITRQERLPRGKVLFQFEGQEYEALFIDGGLQWIRTTSYRIQNGKRVRCSMTRRHDVPSPQLEAAALAALANPAPETAPLGVVDAVTLDAVERAETIKKAVNRMAQQIKAGKVPADVTARFGIWALAALATLPPSESKSA